MRRYDFIENRRFKRLDLSLPIKIRHILNGGRENVQDGITINVSYGGVYVVDIKIEEMKPGDRLNISLAVPRDETRDFPFSRFVGKAKVVRVENDGIALEFNEDMHRLFVVNN
ncbi:PilZ domain-containing protein [bacterium]|nr:PilZ domain-containing protein [bacterium]